MSYLSVHKLVFIYFFVLFLLTILFSNLYKHYMPERRQAEAARIREKYPDRIPVKTFFLLRTYIIVLSFHDY